MSNADRITKLAQKLATIETKRDEYTAQYNDIVNEIASVLAGEAVTAVNKAMSKTSKTKTGGLSEKILQTLTTTPGLVLQDIAKKLKIEPKRVGLALYHLTQKASVFSKEGRYFTATTLAVAAKSVPPEADIDDDEEDTPF